MWYLQYLFLIFIVHAHTLYRCHRWSIFMKMTVNYNWTNIAVFYDDSTSSISVWANSLMTRCNSAGVDYTQFSLTAKSLDISTMLDHARKLARSR